jgi:hypothetical protein
MTRVVTDSAEKEAMRTRARMHAKRQALTDALESQLRGYLNEKAHYELTRAYVNVFKMLDPDRERLTYAIQVTDYDWTLHARSPYDKGAVYEREPKGLEWTLVETRKKLPWPELVVPFTGWYMVIIDRS